MNRLWPIYDLDGEQFWAAFWQCVVCMCSIHNPQTSTNSPASGNYRLWVNGIHHGDVSLKNLMYNVPASTGIPVGVVNDFDLASRIGHSTTNNDRTGTIPFMAIDLLNGGLDSRIPRLYRHDLESFSWVLAYITVAKIEYKGGAIKISSPPGTDAWFKDGDMNDCRQHVVSKRYFHSEYGRMPYVNARYFCYLTTIRHITRYWFDFHDSRRPEVPVGPDLSPTQEESVTDQPEVEDPAGSLGLFIGRVGGAGDGEVFVDIKTCLLGAIKTPHAAVDAV